MFAIISTVTHIHNTLKVNLVSDSKQQSLNRELRHYVLDYIAKVSYPPFCLNENRGKVLPVTKITSCSIKCKSLLSELIPGFGQR